MPIRDDVDLLESKLRDNPAFVEEYEKNRLFAHLTSGIIRARNEAGLSQAKLAKLAGMQQSAIARIESFEYTGVSVKTLARIADALGVNGSLKVSHI